MVSSIKKLKITDLPSASHNKLSQEMEHSIRGGEFGSTGTFSLISSWPDVWLFLMSDTCNKQMISVFIWSLDFEPCSSAEVDADEFDYVKLIVLLKSNYPVPLCYNNSKSVHIPLQTWDWNRMSHLDLKPTKSIIMMLTLSLGELYVVTNNIRILYKSMLRVKSLQ